MKLVLGLVLLSFIGISVVYATSSSIDVYYCDAEHELWGCDKWSRDQRSRGCENKTRIMHWATAPLKSPWYVVTAGSESNPVDVYVPNQLTNIHVRVIKYNKLYRGFLMYAEDNNGTKVGEWTISQEEPPLFWFPFSGGACQNVVMHASAALKPYHVRFGFKAPVGTGSVTFKLLLKQGPANTGEFYWPEKTLTLGEAAPAEVDATNQWVRGDLGQSCDEVCAAAGTDLACWEAKLNSINGGQEFVDALGKDFFCREPLLSGCGPMGATSTTTQFCYYPDATCSAQTRNNDTVKCSAKSSDPNLGRRFCACANKDTIDKGLPGEPTASGASNVVSFTLMMFCLLFAFNKNQKHSIVLIVGLIVVFSSMEQVSAHNWLNNWSRSPVANTYAPCLPRRKETPHVQVGAGQEFQPEWMTGHPGRKTYLTVLHVDNEEKIKLHTESLLNDYLNNCPAGQDKGQDPYLSKKHRIRTAPTDGSDDFFNGQVLPSDPNYFSRPLNIGGRYNNQEGVMYYYNSTQIQNDRRCTYDNEKYPWIISVSRFEHARHMPSEFDTAIFTIDAPPGRYILHYLWGGYRDCVDIDVMPNAVPDDLRYGNATGEYVWERIDHCVFEEPRNIHGVCGEVVVDTRYWQNYCNGGSSCTGVNVVPRKNPDSVYPGFKDINFIWDVELERNCSQYRDAIEAIPGENVFIAFAVSPRTPDVLDEYTISLDPEDPIFYSTCFKQELKTLWIGYDSDKSNYPKSPSGFRFHEKCISCALQRSASDLPGDLTPLWSVADTCVNCDAEPAGPQPIPADDFFAVRERSFCDGHDYWHRSGHHNNCSDSVNCVKEVKPVGGYRLTSESSAKTCAILARRDPECGNEIMARTDGSNSGQCWCYKKEPCCLSCSAVRNNDRYTVFELTPTAADPTCANGVLSADNTTACCSSTCSSCVNGSYVNEPGHCKFDRVTRSCAEHGAPCLL